MQVIERSNDTDSFNDLWAYTEIDEPVGYGFRHIELRESRYEAPTYNIDCLGRLVTQRRYDGEVQYLCHDYFQPGFEPVYLL